MRRADLLMIPLLLVLGLAASVRSGFMMLLHSRASATGFAWPKALGRPQPPFPLALAPHRTVGDELAVPHAPPDCRVPTTPRPPCPAAALSRRAARSP